MRLNRCCRSDPCAGWKLDAFADLSADSLGKLSGVPVLDPPTHSEADRLNWAHRRKILDLGSQPGQRQGIAQPERSSASTVEHAQARRML